MAFFSVVIPTFNRVNLIGKTLESVLRQEFQDYEIIIVDDGSTDGTLNVLAAYGNKIKVLRQQNQGPGVARNLGIQNAKGHYTAFLDSDDLWFPWTLKTYYRIIQENQNPAFLAGNAVFFQDEKELQFIPSSSLAFSTFSDYYASSKRSLWLGTCSVVIQTDILRQVGGFVNKRINAEDSDLWLRLGIAKGFIFIESPMLFAYRQHPNSEISSYRKTYEGIRYLIEQEKTGNYPGEKNRQRERLEILTRHVRPVSLSCLRQGAICEGWQLYQDTLKWHTQLGRIRYLSAFPVIASLYRLR